MARFLGETETTALVGEVRETLWKRVGNAGLDNAFLRPFLEYSARVEFMGVSKVLDALTAYPLDVEKDTAAHDGLHPLRVSEADYQRAVTLLEAANIVVR
jgi:hypothetical protein